MGHFLKASSLHNVLSNAPTETDAPYILGKNSVCGHHLDM